MYSLLYFCNKNSEIAIFYLKKRYFVRVRINEVLPEVHILYIFPYSYLGRLPHPNLHRFLFLSTSFYKPLLCIASCTSRFQLLFGIPFFSAPWDPFPNYLWYSIRTHSSHMSVVRKSDFIFIRSTGSFCSINDFCSLQNIILVASNFSFSILDIIHIPSAPYVMAFLMNALKIYFFLPKLDRFRVLGEVVLLLFWSIS